MSDLKDFSAEEIEQLRASPELQQLFNDQANPYGYPDPPNRDNLLKFFRDVLGLDKEPFQISKTGNLKDGEIGFLSLPVRNYMSLAQFAKSEGWDLVSDYLNNKANITSVSSLGRKARFLELAVTQKRVSKSIAPPSREVKSGLFGSTEVVSGGEE